MRYTENKTRILAFHSLQFKNLIYPNITFITSSCTRFRGHPCSCWQSDRCHCSVRFRPNLRRRVPDRRHAKVVLHGGDDDGDGDGQNFATPNHWKMFGTGNSDVVAVWELLEHPYSHRALPNRGRCWLGNRRHMVPIPIGR